MTLKLTYSGADRASFDDLLHKLPDAAVASPFRSTVPLLCFWRDSVTALSELWAGIALPPIAQVTLAFEHATPVRAGSGKASFTDLMLISSAATVAIEAKYTEPIYESVDAWLGDKEQENRGDVLRGWLASINAVAGSQLDVGHEVLWVIRDCLSGEVLLARSLLSSTQADLAKLLCSPALTFWFYYCPFAPTGTLRVLADRWKGGERNLGSEVRAALLAHTAPWGGSTRLEKVAA